MIRTLALVSVMTVTLAGYSQEKEFILTAENLSTELNDQMVYFRETTTPEPFDSVRITNGSFEKSFAYPIANRFIYMTIGKRFFRLIPEATHIRIIAKKEGSTPYEIASDNPTSLNARLQAYSRELSDALMPLQRESMEVAKSYSTLMKNKGNPQDDKELKRLQARQEEVQKQYSGSIYRIAHKYYQANKDNILGAIIFRELPYESDEEWANAYEKAPNHVKNYELNKKHYDAIQKSAETQVGKQYLDYLIEDGLGNSTKLSDYLRDGRYLVVDFWSSSCGACYKSMPHLRRLSQEKPNAVRILSIGVWEQNKEDNDKAKQKLNMTWDTLFDRDNRGVDLYGLLGVPTLLLISPEGEILVRTHTPDDIDEKLTELNL